WAFVLVGSLGLLWLGAWLLFTRRAELSDVWKDPAPGRSANLGGPFLGVLDLVRSKQFWTTWMVAVLINPCLYFNLNWLPTYFKQERGLSAGQELGWVLTAIYVGLDVGYLASGAAVLGLARCGRSVQGA